MQETEHAVVAKAPAHLDAVLRLAKEINKSYAAAYELRKKANEAGLALGRKIIEACSDEEIIAVVLKRNAKDNKRTGGTPTKVYSYVCDELATANGYNADYLKQCARNYLNALNKSREQKRQEPLVMESGVFKNAPVNPPSAEELKAFVTQPLHPRMDDVAKDASEDAESDQPDEVDVVRTRIQAIKKIFLSADGKPRVNPKAFKVLVQEISEISEAHGYAFGKTMNQSVDQRFGK